MDAPFHVFSPDQSWPRQDQPTFMDNAIATFQQVMMKLVGDIALQEGLIEQGQPFRIDKMDEQPIMESGEKVGVAQVYGCKQTPIIAVAYTQTNVIINIIEDQCQIKLIN